MWENMDVESNFPKNNKRVMDISILINIECFLIVCLIVSNSTVKSLCKMRTFVKPYTAHVRKSVPVSQDTINQTVSLREMDIVWIISSAQGLPVSDTNWHKLVPEIAVASSVWMGVG